MTRSATLVAETDISSGSSIKKSIKKADKTKRCLPMKKQATPEDYKYFVATFNDDKVRRKAMEIL